MTFKPPFYRLRYSVVIEDHEYRTEHRFSQEHWASFTPDEKRRAHQQVYDDLGDLVLKSLEVRSELVHDRGNE